MTYDECKQFIGRFVSIDHEQVESQIIVYISDIWWAEWIQDYFITVMLYSKKDDVYLTSFLRPCSIKTIKYLSDIEEIIYKLKYLL